MGDITRVEEIKKYMQFNEVKKTAKHQKDEYAVFYPFTTRNPERPKFKKGFYGVWGEVTRLINGKELSKDYDVEKCITQITEGITCKNEDDRKYFDVLIKEYILDKNGDIKISHPNLFQYVKFTDGNEGKGEKTIARFVYEVFFEKGQLISSLFENIDSKNMLLKLILSKLEGLSESSQESKMYYDNLKVFTDVAKEDFEFLAKYEDYFIKNSVQLMAYYYFNYIAQVAVKLNKGIKAEFNNLEEIYYLLDWEKASRNRKSVTKGYKFIKDESRNVLIHIYELEQLNFLLKKKNMNFAELSEYVSSLNESEQIDALETIQSWVYEYREFFDLEKKQVNLQFKELLSLLSESLREKVEQATMARYALNIEEIGKSYFLKNRGGSYGFMLNMKKDMLLLITAVCIKDEKITLKELFKQYEKRGLFLDQYSKDTVVDLLGKLNLIDKKSDSGDAQYVKPIL